MESLNVFFSIYLLIYCSLICTLYTQVCVIRCLSVYVYLWMSSPHLLSWSWSKANHFSAPQWKGLMCLSSPEGSDAWQRRTASLPAVTKSVCLRFCVSFFFSYGTFFLQPPYLIYTLSVFFCQLFSPKLRSTYFQKKGTQNKR